MREESLFSSKREEVDLREPSRRAVLQILPAIVLPAWAVGCASLGFGGNKVFKTRVNKKVLWARRQDWSGTEEVRGVVGIGDRFLMIRYRNGNWDFPGGPFIPNLHGEKSEKGEELLYAAADYVHKQALISVVLRDANLFAYGYAIDANRDRSRMVHWFLIHTMASYPPESHGNLNETTDARWISPDEPNLGKCLLQRVQEYLSAGEGNSFILKSCYEFST